MIVLETERLILREILFKDFQELSEILQNPKVMLPWNELFTNQELKRWIADNIRQYKRYRTGYLAVIKKSDLSFIGIIGVVKLHIKNSKFYELGYILKEKYRGKGYAIESIKRCINYASQNLNIREIYLCTDISNDQSQKLINSLGFKFVENHTSNSKCFSKYKLTFLK